MVALAYHVDCFSVSISPLLTTSPRECVAIQLMMPHKYWLVECYELLAYVFPPRFASPIKLDNELALTISNVQRYHDTAFTQTCALKISPVDSNSTPFDRPSVFAQTQRLAMADAAVTSSPVLSHDNTSDAEGNGSSDSGNKFQAAISAWRSAHSLPHLARVQSTGDYG